MLSVIENCAAEGRAAAPHEPRVGSSEVDRAVVGRPACDPRSALGPSRPVTHPLAPETRARARGLSLSEELHKDRSVFDERVDMSVSVMKLSNAGTSHEN